VLEQAVHASDQVSRLGTARAQLVTELAQQVLLEQGALPLGQQFALAHHGRRKPRRDLTQGQFGTGLVPCQQDQRPLHGEDPGLAVGRRTGGQGPHLGIDPVHVHRRLAHRKPGPRSYNRRRVPAQRPVHRPGGPDAGGLSIGEETAQGGLEQPGTLGEPEQRPRARENRGLGFGQPVGRGGGRGPCLAALPGELLHRLHRPRRLHPRVVLARPGVVELLLHAKDVGPQGAQQGLRLRRGDAGQPSRLLGIGQGVGRGGFVLLGLLPVLLEAFGDMHEGSAVRRQALQ
jgi:hypothetical protein